MKIIPTKDNSVKRFFFNCLDCLPHVLVILNECFVAMQRPWIIFSLRVPCLLLGGLSEMCCWFGYVAMSFSEISGWILSFHETRQAVAAAQRLRSANPKAGGRR